MNPYEILGVPENATNKEIQTAYHILAKQHHPDQGGDPEQMAAINHAYNLISTPEKRERFEKYGDKPKAQVSEFELSFIMYVQAAFAQFDDPIAQLKKKLKKERHEAYCKVMITTQELRAINKRKKKFLANNDPVEIIVEAIDALIGKLEDQQSKLQKSHDDLTKMIDTLSSINEEPSLDTMVKDIQFYQKFFGSTS